MRITFLGVGLMGQHQARRLLKAGHNLSVWNRTRAKAEALLAAGAMVADTVTEAVSNAEVVISMLENGRVVSDVLINQGALTAVPAGSTVIDMSSIEPGEAQKHASLFLERGIGHLDAPVSGGTAGAESGTLTIFVGGEQDTFESVRDVFTPMGTAHRLGPSGSGQLAKLANQIVVAATIGGLAEALLLVERGGGDPAAVRNALQGGFADSRVLDLHGNRMVQRDFQTRGRSVTHLKDLENARRAGERMGVALPFAELTAELYRDLIAHRGDLDHSALLLELERRADKRG